MNRNYWERIAPAYEDEIFDVLKNDTSGKIVTAIQQLASAKKTVVDIGCAVGKWLPLLSAGFKHVTATDIAAENLAIAKKKYTALTNVEYIRTDMSDGKAALTPCDVAICINAILTDSLPKRIHFFKALYKCVKKNGALILVVPSLESKLYANIIAHRWNVDNDNTEKKPTAKKAMQLAQNIKQGVTDIDNVPTKHYLREELELLLTKEGFSITAVEKINYTWKTEFHHPPKWLKAPYPWDWMVIARK
jgi:2-polyprenyl-3-methyl-5-hydroxy-6-metoxy-1,4-benzoquinol methylase